MLCCRTGLLEHNLCNAAQAGMLRAAAPLVAARAGAVDHRGAVAVDVGGCHRDHQQRAVEKVWKLMWLRMLKLLLDCMLPSCPRFATLVVTDLRRAFGEHMRERACVRVLWVACVRDFAGDGRRVSDQCLPSCRLRHQTDPHTTDGPFCGVVRTCGGEGMRQGGYGSRAGSRGGRGRGPQSLAGLCSAYAQSCEGTACMRVAVGTMVHGQ